MPEDVMPQVQRLGREGHVVEGVVVVGSYAFAPFKDGTTLATPSSLRRTPSNLMRPQEVKEHEEKVAPNNPKVNTGLPRKDSLDRVEVPVRASPFRE